MSVSYDYYKVFYKVAECGNITAAARELYLVQSTVSRTVQNLERELGCRLLARSAQGIRLTQEGEVLYRHLKPAFAHIEVAEERLANLRRLNEGTLRIGASELTLTFYLLPILERFIRDYPGVHVRLSFSSPAQAVPDLSSGMLDLAVLGSPLVEDADVDVRRLRPADFTLIAGPLFSELAGEPVDLKELAEYPFITMEKGTSVRLFADRMAQEAGFTLRPECEVGSMPLLLSMVKLNLGLAFVPALHAQELLADGSVLRLRPRQELPEQHICLLTSRIFPGNAVTERFSSLLPSLPETDAPR